jgi:hypothetical protein
MPSRDYDEQMTEGYYSLPSERERAKMSVLQLAELLSTRKQGLPDYLVIEHELNLKIAKLQAKVTLQAGWLSVVGSILTAIVGAALGYFIGTSQQKETSNQAQKSQVIMTQPAATHAGSSKVQRKKSVDKGPSQK